MGDACSVSAAFYVKYRISDTTIAHCALQIANLRGLSYTGNERILLIPFYCNTNQRILQTLFCVFCKYFYERAVFCVPLMENTRILALFVFYEDFGGFSGELCKMCRTDVVGKLNERGGTLGFHLLRDLVGEGGCLGTLTR